MAQKFKLCISNNRPDNLCQLFILFDSDKSFLEALLTAYIKLTKNYKVPIFIKTYEFHTCCKSIFSSYDTYILDIDRD